MKWEGKYPQTPPPKETMDLVVTIPAQKLEYSIDGGKTWTLVCTVPKMRQSIKLPLVDPRQVLVKTTPAAPCSSTHIERTN